MEPKQALAFLTLIGTLVGAWGQQKYFGKDLGALSELHHGVRGRLYAVDSRTLYLKDFHYDGEGPAAYFIVGSSKSVGAAGSERLPDERGNSAPLRRYRGESLTLALPEGKTLKDFRWFSVWCDEFAVNFGDVSIPRELEYPRPARVAALRGVHGVSSDPVVVVDAQTLLLPNFSYDGEAPDAKFWVGRGKAPSPQGIRIPDENGKETPLRKYDKKTIVLTLPGELTVFDVGHLAVWCEAFTVNFGHVSLPAAALANVPPSLKMLGVSPQSKLNCEVLFEELAFEVRWAVAGDSIVIQLVAKLEDGEYMAFGISGDPEHTQMVGGDVTVARVEMDTLKGHAVDYYLDAKSQCAGSRGSCPDEAFAENTNSVRLLNAALVNGYSIVTYQRSLKAADELDKPILTNTSQPIIWAIGPLNSKNEVSYHSHFGKTDRLLEFGRAPAWRCPAPDSDTQQVHSEGIKPHGVPPPAPAAAPPGGSAWHIPGVQCDEPADGVLYAQLGPTGGKRGYSAITGHVGWGISWYINGLLIPEVTVVRGKKYTFVVEGGTDPDVPAKYHPFYISNDPVGGYFHKSEEEKKGIEIYAGVRRTRSGELIPTGVGRLCNWTPDPEGPEADEYPSFGAYQRSLTLVCEEGNPGVITWTPDKNTPDTVYYQCFTHRHLGWKINVVDVCDVDETDEASESRLVEAVALRDDLHQEESIQVQSRIRPASNFLDQRKKFQKIMNMKPNYDDFSSDSRSDGGFSGETMYRHEQDRNHLYTGPKHEPPLSKVQIKEVIEAVESIESQMKEHIKRNATNEPINQYQVHEDVKEFYHPEQPITDDGEYLVETSLVPERHFFPHNQKPLTLQSVLRPNGKPIENYRPSFRRPAPPEIKLRRPSPGYQKVNSVFPLPMPTLHGPYSVSKKSHHNYPNKRLSPNVRNPMPGMSSVKFVPQGAHVNPIYNYQTPTKLFPKVPNGHSPIFDIGKTQNAPIVIPSNTLSLGKTDLIANKVVKSQIILPGTADAIEQYSVPQVNFNKPGQIILGKPMDNPQPLDQQLSPAKSLFNTSVPEIYTSSSHQVQINSKQSAEKEIISSDFIGESTDTPYISPAVNTGFKPDSIVIESGFKPIIREPLMASEDKIAEYDGTNANRREDTGVEEDYEENPQYISNEALIENKVSSEQLTETFEPMFVPSPPDHLLSSNDKTKEVFPNNHAKEDRPHPVYIKTENELNALFGKKNILREAPVDIIMQPNRKHLHYLPPDPKTAKEPSQKIIKKEETYTAFDGKMVSASSLTVHPEDKTSNIFSSEFTGTKQGTILESPQFGPFKGEIPPISNTDNDDDDDLKSISALDIFKSFHESEEKNIKDLEADGSEIEKTSDEERTTESLFEDEVYDDELEEVSATHNN